jgi:hypothetical protein
MGFFGLSRRGVCTLSASPDGKGENDKDDATFDSSELLDIVTLTVHSDGAVEQSLTSRIKVLVDEDQMPQEDSLMGASPRANNNKAWLNKGKKEIQGKASKAATAKTASAKQPFTPSANTSVSVECYEVQVTSKHSKKAVSSAREGHPIAEISVSMPLLLSSPSKDGIELPAEDFIAPVPAELSKDEKQNRFLQNLFKISNKHVSVTEDYAAVDIFGEEDSVATDATSPAQAVLDHLEIFHDYVLDLVDDAILCGSQAFSQTAHEQYEIARADNTRGNSMDMVVGELNEADEVDDDDSDSDADDEAVKHVADVKRTQTTRQQRGNVPWKWRKQQPKVVDDASTLSTSMSMRLESAASF